MVGYVHRFSLRRVLTAEEQNNGKSETGGGGEYARITIVGARNVSSACFRYRGSHGRSGIGRRPLAGAVPAKADPSGATRIVISSNTQFGRVLAVGNGPFAGFSVYFITSDFDHHFGCTAVLLHLVIGPIQCTGPASNTSVE